MKTVSDYRADMLTILGDAGGRRYTESMMDMGLREALSQYRAYCPRKETVRQKVAAVDEYALVLPGFLSPDVEILTVRDEEGNFLNYAEYRTAEKVYINLYGCLSMPAAGSVLTLELALPHVIKDLDEARMTSVPDGHALMICTGAAGYAMRIRARSVTEVFGKRPEDREALSSQANRLIADFNKELYSCQPASYDPLPRGGFEI